MPVMPETANTPGRVALPSDRVIIGGVEWITTGEACERLAPDVGPETLRNWYAPRDGRPPTVRVLRDPDGRPVRLRRQLLVCWADVVEAEHTARTQPAGRPRNTA